MLYINSIFLRQGGYSFYFRQEVMTVKKSQNSKSPREYRKSELTLHRKDNDCERGRREIPRNIIYILYI